MDIYQAFRSELEHLVKAGAVRAFSSNSAEGVKMQRMQGEMGASSYEPMFGPKGQGMSISGSFKPTMVNGYSPAGGTFAGRFLWPLVRFDSSPRLHDSTRTSISR